VCRDCDQLPVPPDALGRRTAVAQRSRPLQFRLRSHRLHLSRADAQAVVYLDQAHCDSLGGAYRDLLRNRTVWALVLARVFADPVAWFYNAWVPEYLVRSAGFSMSDIGRYAWIPFFINGVGIVVGGMASDSLCRREWAVIPARMAVMLTGVLLMTFGVICAFSVSVGVAITVISVAVFGFGLWAPNMMSLGADAFPRHSGSVTGLSGTGAGIGGMIYTLMTGWLLDTFGYGPVFVVSGVAPLVAFGLLYRLFEVPPATGAADT
jgi:ACS family hexuronate transporter-like MFS transporter